MNTTTSHNSNLSKKNKILGTKTPRTLAYKPEFDLDFVERLLGRRQRNDLPRATRNRLIIQKKRLSYIITPRLIWKKLPIARIDKTGVTLGNGIYFKSRKMARALQGAVAAVGFIATLGGKIDREIASLMHGGSLAHGYVADALGSGAVEKAADRFHNEMARKVALQGQSVGLRFSPGYCDWPVSDQHKLFSLLDHEAVGVELGDTALMSPRKSISAVFGIFEQKNGQWEKGRHNPCRQCGKKNCLARRVEAVPPLS